MEYNMNLDYEVYTNNFLIESEFKYYFLGIICADGSLSEKGNGISISLKESDKEFLDLLREKITSKKLRYNPKTKAYTLYFASSIVKNEMMRYINTYQKTKSLIYPPNIPARYQKDFIRGYFDGDGNINVKMSYRVVKQENKSYPGVRLRILGTFPFLLGLAQTLKNENVINFIRTPSRKGSENVFYIEYAFRSANAIMDWLYNGAIYFLPRKKQVYNHIRNIDKTILIDNYTKKEGFYNTLASRNQLIDEEIVGSLSKDSG
jgi:hypothetical protein